MPRPETQRWLDKAAEDKRAFELLRQNGELSTASYHAQQAAEKYIKAVVVEAQIAPRYVHDLQILLGQVPNFSPSQALDEACGRLTTYATLFRYPGATDPLPEDIDEAAVDLETVIQWATGSIP